MKIETVGKSFVTLTRDPKDIGKKNAVVTFTVAENHNKKDKNGDWVEDGVSFWNVVSFGELGDEVMDTLKKGDAIRLSGKIRMETWEDKEGEKRITPKVVLDSFEKVEFEKKKRRDEDDDRSSRSRSRRNDDQEDDQPKSNRSNRNQSTRNSGRRAPWKN